MNLDVNGKKVLIRVDFNVPVQEGHVTDTFRIEQAIPTIKEVLKNGADQVLLLSHLGRPGGERNPDYSLKPLVKKVETLLERDVGFLDWMNEDEADERVVLLENLRFHPGEREDSKELAKELSGFGDVYINDAFGVSHRKHCSVHALPKRMKSCLGRLVQRELAVFEELEQPDHPFVSILGGSKLKTKLGLIESLLSRVDNILLGGGMIFAFYKVKGLEIGNSILDEDGVGKAKELLDEEKIVLPTDVVVGDEADSPDVVQHVPVKNIPKELMGLDIGENSIETFKDILDDAETVVWNGPLGYYETEQFAIGTRKIMKYLAGSDKKVVIGGGDTGSVVADMGLREDFYHVSTGGGASMTLLKGDPLPGIEAAR